VDLVQVFPLDAEPAGSGPFLVATAAVGADGSFSFGPEVPAGIYTAVLRRFSQALDLSLVETARQTAPFALTAGQDLQLAF
jgi:hypothetical protein